MPDYSGGLIINDFPIWRERATFPETEITEEITRMADGTPTCEVAYEKYVLTCKYDILEPDVIAFIKSVQHDPVIFKYYKDDGSNEMVEMKGIFTEKLKKTEIRAWDYDYDPPLPMYGGWTFKLEEY